MPKPGIWRFGLLAFLTLLAASAKAEPFSVKCVLPPWLYVTFDEASGHAVWEVQDATVYAGVIDYFDDNEIRFHLLINPKDTIRTWHRKTGYLTLAGSNSEGMPCVKTELRRIIFEYDRLYKFRGR
jgi:hypothetical protein